MHKKNNVEVKYISLNIPIVLGDFPAVKVGDEVLLFGGGSKEKFIDIVWRHNLISNEISEFTKMPYPARGHQVVLLGKRCFLLGGFDGKGTSNSVYVLDINTMEWLECAPMPLSNSWFAAIGINGLIYVFGGFGIPRGYYTSIFTYNPEVNEWNETKEAFPSDIYPKGALGSQAIVEYKGKILNIGGANFYDPDTNDCNTLGIISEYNPEKNTWHKLDIEIEAFESGNAVLVEDKLYVVGGDSGSSGILSKIQIVDLKLGSVEKSILLAEPRKGAPLAVYDKKIFVYGGVVDPPFSMTSTIEIISISN